MKFLKFCLHFTLVVLLSILTQVGGLLYLIVVLATRKIHRFKLIKQIIVFLLVYLICSLLLIPKIAPYFGREKLETTEHLQAQSLFYVLANRDYVKPKLKEALQEIARDFSKYDPNLTVVYLDANFPFFDGFPLLPHLSHNDGKKIDLAFIYKDEKGRVTNEKPSRSGYGIYEAPNSGELDQTQACKEAGYWQYDFTRYVSFGNRNPELTLSNEATKQLVKLILNQKETSKLFLEPHLVQRMNLSDPKIRFHGCRAVRHDDHIHFQIN